MIDDRERTAVHEAGHAVAGYLLGRRPDWVTIRPSEQAAGLTTFLRRGGGPVVIPGETPAGWPVVGMDARSRRVSEVSMLVVLAGHAAERVYCAPSEAREHLHSVVDIDPPDWRGLVHDGTGAFEMAVRQSPGAARELVEYLFAEATQLARHPAFTALLVPLTEALLEHETLAGPQVRKLLREAERNYNETRELE